MNIKEAKEQIKIAMKAYFTKDEFGNYRIPLEKQRPIFLMGPPGIGKTAIMEQVSQELGVALVSYSMTHHTRQSAIGLPFIENKTYNGKIVPVSEYTMSEIIASVYDKIEETGIKEGILFLDEVNCVSETLAPSMLQFLQYKVFGRHRIPDGWIVVTAGNPPEYNKSVREFDIVTWDRLKRIDIEEDYTAWKEFAYVSLVHPSILTYLDIKKNNFYKIESTVDGRSFVTARGWSDLSDMIRICEDIGEDVNEKIIGQYLQNKAISKDFAAYYDLFKKYRSDYQVNNILAGNYDESIKERALKARFDERLALVGLLIEAIGTDMRDTMYLFHTLKELKTVVTELKAKASGAKKSLAESMSDVISSKEKALADGKQSGVMSADTQNIQNMLIKILNEEFSTMNLERDNNKAFDVIKKDFNSRVGVLRKKHDTTEKHITNMFDFAKKVFDDGQEILIIITEMTINKHTAAYLSQYGSAEYFKYNNKLMLNDRMIKLSEAIEDLSEEE